MGLPKGHSVAKQETRTCLASIPDVTPQSGVTRQPASVAQTAVKIPLIPSPIKCGTGSLLKGGISSWTAGNDRRSHRFGFFGAILAILPSLFLASWLPGQDRHPTTAEGFAIPRVGYPFQFPRDHGSHPEFRTEWWYVTAHLRAATGERFGLQSTFFRQAAPRRSASNPQAATIEAPELFRKDHLFLAHMALLDVQTGAYLYQERLNRNGWDAFSHVDRQDMRNGNWSLRSMVLHGSVEGRADWHLTLEPQKPLVIFGADGVSRKGDDRAAASYYLSWTRLAVKGSLRIAGNRHEVSGSAWLDHEISSSQLAPDQVGWDWASLQLNDGREIMVYRMRKQNGSIDRHSTLAWVDRGGNVRHFGPSEFDWLVDRTWRSNLNGAVYPTRVTIRTEDPDDGAEVVFRLMPLAEAQEIGGEIGGIAYWEGACEVVDENNRPVGMAFLELTGYAGSLQGRF